MLQQRDDLRARRLGRRANAGQRQQRLDLQLRVLGRAQQLCQRRHGRRSSGTKMLDGGTRQIGRFRPFERGVEQGGRIGAALHDRLERIDRNRFVVRSERVFQRRHDALWPGLYIAESGYRGPRNSSVRTRHSFCKGIERGVGAIPDFAQGHRRVIFDNRILVGEQRLQGRGGRLGLRTIVAKCPGSSPAHLSIITCELFLQLGDNRASRFMALAQIVDGGILLTARCTCGRFQGRIHIGGWRRLLWFRLRLGLRRLDGRFGRLLCLLRCWLRLSLTGRKTQDQQRTNAEAGN